MAISKIHPIRYSVLDAVNYIIDPDKTNGEMYVSSYACAIHTADLEFAQTASKGTSRGDIKAQHLIQAFAPGEVDVATAHEIGQKFAMEVTEGKYEFVLATHIDKDHVHNHILFNQVDFIDHRKYRGNIYCQRQIAKINDALCASYGLSVIKPGEQKGKSYYDYKDLKTNNSNRQVLKNTIDSCIPLVENIDELLMLLQKTGYEIKVTNQNYSLRKEGQERFIRLKNLGEKYTYDALVSRIKHKSSNASPYIAPPKQLGLLVDLSDRLDKIKNPNYHAKVALSEVKRVAATYAFLNEHNLSSVSEIEQRQDEWSKSIKEKHDSIKSMEKEIDTLTSILENLEKKERYNDVYATYLKKGKSKSYFDEHKLEMSLFNSAVQLLASQNVSPYTTSVDIKERLEALTNEKNSLLDSYHTDMSNLKQLNIAAKNVEMILAMDEKNKREEKDKKKHRFL